MTPRGQSEQTRYMGGPHDSPRWCEKCKTWGDHHTDRCSRARERCCGIIYEHGAFTQAQPCHDCPEAPARKGAA